MRVLPSFSPFAALLVGVLCLAVAAAGLPALAEVLPPNYRLEPVVRGLTSPQAMALAPDGRIFVLERTTGKVRVVQQGKLLETPTSFGSPFFKGGRGDYKNARLKASNQGATRPCSITW